VGLAAVVVAALSVGAAWAQDVSSTKRAEASPERIAEALRQGNRADALEYYRALVNKTNQLHLPSLRQICEAVIREGLANASMEVRVQAARALKQSVDVDRVPLVLEVLRERKVPEDFIMCADEVVVVDAPPEAATPARARQLSTLRQRALLLTADVVDRQLEHYLRLHGIDSSWGTQERILVCMTPRANAAKMLESGRRNADRFHGELFAIYVVQENLTAEDGMANERNATLARAQHAHIEVLEGRDPVATILDYARRHHITQIFVGHNLRRNWRARLRGTPLERLIRDAEGIDIRVFPQ
jgi:nucleotide-binding universal stress UspA family protein